MPQYVYPGDLLPNTLAQASDINSRVTGLAAAVNNVDGTQLLAGVVALTHLTPTLAAMVVQAGALPASPAAYQPWVDTADKRLKVYNGASWDKYAAETLAQTWAAQQTFSLPIAAPVNPNLLPNPTWAQGFAYWGVPGGVGFSAVADPDGSGTILQLPASNASTLNVNSEFIPVAAGTELTLSWYINTLGLATLPGSIRSLLTFYESDKATQTGQFVQGVPPWPTTWTKQTLTATAPANTAYVQVTIQPSNYTLTASEWIGWKQFKLEQGSVATMFTDDQGANPATLLNNKANVEQLSVASGGTILSLTPNIGGVYAVSAQGAAWSVTVNGVAQFTGVASGAVMMVYCADGQAIVITNDSGATNTYSAAIANLS